MKKISKSVLIYQNMKNTGMSMFVLMRRKQRRSLLRKIIFPISKEFENNVQLTIISATTYAQKESDILQSIGISKHGLPIVFLVDNGQFVDKIQKLNYEKVQYFLKRNLRNRDPDLLTTNVELNESPELLVKRNFRDRDLGVRVTEAELNESPELLKGEKPFVLVDAMKNWSAIGKWDLSYLMNKWGDSTVDFYPNNMYNAGAKPYLIPLRLAIHNVFKTKFKPHRVIGNDDKSQPGYIHWRFGEKEYNEMREDIKADRTPWLNNNWQWFQNCVYKNNSKMDLADSGGDDEDREPLHNLAYSQAMFMVLIGTTGSGMFFHPDGINSGGWQAQIVGRKRYVVCDANDVMSTSDDAFSSKFQNSYMWDKYNCVDIIVHPGEIAFWPVNSWHSTKVLDDIYISFTMRHWGPFNFRQQLLRETFGDVCRRRLEDGCDECLRPILSSTVCGAIDTCFGNTADFAPYRN